MDGKVYELIQSLHQGAWFQLLGSDRYIVPKIGGRQGCKLGRVVLNMIYSIAIHELAESMRELGVVLTLDQTDESFWGSVASIDAAPVDSVKRDRVHCISHVEFVDDAALLMRAQSPAKLLEALPCVLSR